ncbi:F-box only protein 47 [Esox lucius]|uniref:F-box domain-containing protein n=1 Tax=Esox lucius TaxID=8010 RepID=A0A3P8XQM2_ESOLU|nr:F-box only protein 47 [Esox lucius]
MATLPRKCISQRFHRRRCREPYPVRTITTRSQDRGSGCFFERLPAEVFDMVLDRLSVLEISVFSMVSKAISRYVMNHVSTQAWRNRKILQKLQPHQSSYPPSKNDTDTLSHYKALGLLYKRCTLLLPTKDRLKFIYSTFSQVPCFMMLECTASTDCPFFSSYGAFLQTLIAGWDELECHRVFVFLCDFTNLPQKIKSVVTGKPGVCQRLELQIRGFCRQVLLEPWSSHRDTLFWLTRILQPWPMVSQARLLFILYGPLLPDGSLGWQELLGAGVPQCSLWDLAKALILLHSNLEATDWTTDTVMGILEELTVLPRAWHVESVARLLVLCGNTLCYSILASKALNGRLFEISQLLVYLVLVCEKEGYCMNWSVRMVQQVCQVFSSPADRWSFIQSIENMFSEVTMEMYEVVMAGNHHEDMETFGSLCSVLNASAHFHTEVVYMFLKD